MSFQMKEANQQWGLHRLSLEILQSVTKHQSTLYYHFVGNTMVTTFRMSSFIESVEMKAAVNNSKEKLSMLQGEWQSTDQKLFNLTSKEGKFSDL